MDDETFALCLRASDAVLFPKIYDALLPLFVAHTQRLDQKLNALATTLRGMSHDAQFDVFGASSSFRANLVVESDRRTLPLYAPCIASVVAMRDAVTPSDKLAALVACCQLAEQGIAQAGKVCFGFRLHCSSSCFLFHNTQPNIYI
jgi:hypothetical protein